MTSPRYRCAWCGSFSTNRAPDAREHVLTKHRRALEALLRPLSSFPDLEDPEEI